MDTMTPATTAHDPAFYAEQLPVFVYGTLRTGEGNWDWALRGRTVAETPGAVIDSARMYAGPGFPYVSEGEPGETVVGDLMHVDPDCWADVSRDLDRLEGFSPDRARNHYLRVRREVALPDGTTVTAWTYLAGDAPRGQRIHFGDWLAYQRRSF